MTLELYYHPLASYCWKALIGFYESEIRFDSHIVDLGNAEQRAALEAMWPFAKFPVLRDRETGETTPESSIILERLALTHASARWILPVDAEKALATRALDRFFDTSIHDSMQKIVGDRIRAEDARDPAGVQSAHATITKAYAYLEPVLADREWANGESFSLADCAAYPALYYGHRVHPVPASCPNVAAYLARLSSRPCVQEVMAGAEPYLHMFPG